MINDDNIFIYIYIHLLYPSFKKKLQELVDDARNKKQATFKVNFLETFPS